MFIILGQNYKGGGQFLRDRQKRAITDKGQSYFASDNNTPNWNNNPPVYEEDKTYYIDEEELTITPNKNPSILMPPTTKKKLTIPNLNLT